MSDEKQYHKVMSVDKSCYCIEEIVRESPVGSFGGWLKDDNSWLPFTFWKVRKGETVIATPEEVEAYRERFNATTNSGKAQTIMDNEKQLEKVLKSFGFDDRQIKEVKLAMIYAYQEDENGELAFAHGTVGHNQLMIIAKLAACLMGKS